MTRHLQSAICIIQRTRSIRTTRVLRVNEFFENVQMRRFDATSQPVSNTARKLADFGNDPLQQIASQDDGSWFGWWCCGCGHRFWHNLLENFEIFFAKWMPSYVRRFTADSASGLPLEVYRLRFTASGLRAKSDTPFANPLFTGKNDPKMSVFCP